MKNEGLVLVIEPGKADPKSSSFQAKELRIMIDIGVSSVLTARNLSFYLPYSYLLLHPQLH